MARGRKKDGYKIDDLSDREDIINKIINQANSMNKKIKAFKEEDIEEYETYYKQLLGESVKYTKSGLISKSKKQFENENIFMLKRTLSALHTINNNEYYGTVNKYKKEVTKAVRGAIDYTSKYLTDKGYDTDFINKTTNSKEFMSKLFMALNEGQRRYDSNQVIDKIALQYDDTGLSDEEMNKILSNIEYSQTALEKIRREQEEFEEFQRIRRMR